MDTRQTELELLARDRGIERARASVQRALDRERASETFAGLEMLRRAVEPAANAIAEFLVNAEVGGRGRRPTLFRLAGHCDPFLLAYVTGKVALDRAAHNAPLLRGVLGIGAAVEDELRLAAFEAQEPNLYNTIARSLRKRGSQDPGHMRAVWSTSAHKAGIEVPRWTRNEKVQVGVVLFDLFAEATGLVERKLVWVRESQSQWKMKLSDKASAWFADRNEKAGLLRPAYMPTVVPPAEWTGLRGGGYHTDHLFDLPFIKRTRPEHIEELRHADLSCVYAGLNAIQNTPWQINGKVLPVLRDAWDSGLAVQCLPKREDTELPPKPVDIASNAETRRKWKEEARLVYEANTRERGVRFEFARLLSLAGELGEEPMLYFPHQLDFRGRCYAVPAGLNPQGPDEAKALLTFAQAKPVSTPEAEKWLFVHGANVFGFDKAGLDERRDWALSHLERAIATAQEPMRDLWWTEADKPWSFLAWCFEAERVTRGDGMSSLPIALDGSCNGLQHFSAMLRDPIGGAAVNLVPSDTPQDIYQRVADRTIEMLLEMRARSVYGASPAFGDQATFEAAVYSTGWLAFGIDRKITKRPVMVLPYGGTRMSCLKYVRDEVRERLRAGQENPFGDQLSRAEVFLSGVIWRSIGDVVVAARAAMDWLQQAARVAASFNLPLTWTTPSGFVAHQSYLDRNLRRIKTRSRGELVRLSDYTDGRKLDRYRQALGISPNFVHSMDAAAMMLTIRDAAANGVTQLAMIHDSYGTVAADTEALSVSLRRAFVDMYEQHDVLAEFAAELTARLPESARHLLPPPPPKGGLDIRAVHSSSYFFA